MIDEGEVDWKVLVVQAADPRAALIQSLDDVEKHFPGQIARVREWFTWYKAVDGARRQRWHRHHRRVYGKLGTRQTGPSECKILEFGGNFESICASIEGFGGSIESSWAKIASLGQF